MWQREEEKTHWHSVGSGKCHSPIDDHAVGHDVLSGDRVRIPRADRRIRHDEILLLSSYAANFPETGHEASSLSRMRWVRLGTSSNGRSSTSSAQRRSRHDGGQTGKKGGQLRRQCVHGESMQRHERTMPPSCKQDQTPLSLKEESGGLQGNTPLPPSAGGGGSGISYRVHQLIRQLQCDPF